MVRQDNPRNIKLVIVGDGGVGKTTFSKMLTGKDFDPKYRPTLGVETSSLDYNGDRYTIWDTAGQEKYSGLKDGYYVGAECAIVMASDITSIEKIGSYIGNIIERCGEIPMVFVLNKTDINEVKNLLQPNWNVIPISCKQNIDIWKPLEILSSKMKI